MAAEATSGRRRAIDHSRWLSPLTVALLTLASVPLVFPDRALDFYWSYMAAYVVPPGKAVVIPAAVARGYDPFLVATYGAIIDSTAGWFLAWNWDLTTRLPWVGKYIERIMAAGERKLEGSWVAQRAGFIGLSLYVFAPVEGSGAFGGTIIGRLVGMAPQRTWLAVVVGSVTSAFLWAYASHGMATLFTHLGVEATMSWILIAVASMAFVILALGRWRR